MTKAKTPCYAVDRAPRRTMVKRSRTPGACVAGVIFVAASSCVGCASVRPWQRGALAHECMRADARPEESLARTHMLGAREGSSGAAGERGGGCGCK